MMNKRTDLALEAHELWQESAAEETKLPGVAAREYMREGCSVTCVRILDAEGSKALEKPEGTYITIELSELMGRESGAFNRSVKAVAGELNSLLPEGNGCVLTVGLGNRAITPDAIGPLAMESVMVTRHLVETLPSSFGHLRPVAAISPGVLGLTGMESIEMINGALSYANADYVIIIDALASRKISRLCTTIQLADTGIVPGSGVGNSRAALNLETLGIPVIAIGVPTVVDAVTLAADLAEQAGITNIDPSLLSPHSGGLIVTPKEIDTNVKDLARIIGYALNLCLQPGISVEDITYFLS